ncbi:MAG: 50S ribosomal protein L30 [Actinobacteria bacterium]|nr:50S ribosomal protein L30 [Actinomycetota bacterium]
MSQIKVTQTKSIIGRRADHRRTMRALGLRKMNHSVVHEDSPQIRGMIHQVRYMVEVEEVKGSKQ